MKFEYSVQSDGTIKCYIDGKELPWLQCRECNDKYIALTSSFYYGWFNRKVYDYLLLLLKEEINA